MNEEQKQQIAEAKESIAKKTNNSLCRWCNKKLSFDKISKCMICRHCHPIQILPFPDNISWSLCDFSGCSTVYEIKKRAEYYARRNGWEPEKFLIEETKRRFG